MSNKNIIADVPLVELTDCSGFPLLIQEFQSFLSKEVIKAENDGYFNLRIDRRGYYDIEEWWLVGDRYETDNELEIRLASEARRAEKIRNSELKKLEKLKAKYG